MRGAFDGSFDALVEAGDVYVENTSSYPFDALRFVTWNFIVHGDGPSCPSALENVGGTLIVSGALSTYDALISVRHDVELDTSDLDWTGFSSLTSAGGLNVTCRGGSFDGAAQLQFARSIRIIADECSVGGVGALENIDRELEVRLLGRGATVTGFRNLTSVGAIEFLDGSDDNPDIFASIEVVDGPFRASAAASMSTDFVVAGFDNVETIEGDFSVHDATAITGLSALHAIGGAKLLLPAQMSVADRDAFLAQIHQFAGEIIVE